MFLFVVLPVLLVTLWVAVDTWRWRGILLGAVVLATAWSGIAGQIVAVAIIMGVAVGSSLYRVTGSPV